MSVIYQRDIIAKGAKSHHFKDKGINIRLMYKTYPDKYTWHHQLKFIFSRDNLTGIIRTTCNGITFAVDVYRKDLQGFNNRACLTTECKTVQEAKNILYVWFRDPNYPAYLK